MADIDILSCADLRVGAAVNDKQSAERLEEALLEKNLAEQKHIKIMDPNDKDADAQLKQHKEKEIGSNMLNWHLYLGSMGVVIGFLVAGALVSYGPAFTQANPYLTFIALLSPGLFLGLFASGLISLRPDKDAFNQSMISSIAKGKWAIIIKPNSESQRSKVMAYLKSHHSARVISS
ncbi:MULTISPECIES: hypothetical protein [unclassified Pseudoalteromonas]|uniref:hypothetical protein n=1 Tax=unclassified Pseudoalteromonas TaxID=194690 RepID=UPI0030151AAC